MANKTVIVLIPLLCCCRWGRKHNGIRFKSNLHDSSLEYRTDVIPDDKPVCFRRSFGASPSPGTGIWQLWMSFVFPASVWEARWRVEAYELWHAYCNNDGKEEDSREWEGKKKKIEKIKKHISILSAVSCLCLHQNVCFLRMKVVFVLTLLRIWVDKVSKPCEQDGHLRNMNLRLCDSQDRSEEPVMCA